MARRNKNKVLDFISRYRFLSVILIFVGIKFIPKWISKFKKKTHDAEVKNLAKVVEQNTGSSKDMYADAKKLGLLFRPIIKIPLFGEKRQPIIINGDHNDNKIVQLLVTYNSTEYEALKIVYNKETGENLTEDIRVALSSNEKAKLTHIF